MDIIFSANNREEVFVLPFVPTGTQVDEPQDNDTFQGLSRDLNIIGNMGLKTLSITSFFPCKNYDFIRPGASFDGWSYVNFFRKWRERKMPIRIVILGNNGEEILNMACTIDSFTWEIMRRNDISYSLSIREYKFL